MRIVPQLVAWFLIVSGCGAIVNVEIISILPLDFGVASALIWTAPAFEVAVEAANKRYATFLNFSVVLMYNASDRTCEDVSGDAVRNVSEYYYTKTNSDTVYAIVSSSWDWVLFSNALAQDTFLDDELTPTAIAVGGTFHGYSTMIINVLLNFGWFHISVLLQTNAFSPFYANIFGSLVAQGAVNASNRTFFINSCTFLPNTKSMADALDNAKQRSRVVIILAPAKIALELLVFINVQPLQQSEFGNISLFSQPRAQNLKAFRAFLFMSYRASGHELQDLNDKIVNRAKAMFRAEATGYTADSPPLDSFATQASYDLVDMLAQVVNESLPFHAPGSGWSGTMLATRMSNRTFKGLTAGDLYVTPEGERCLDMDIYGFSTASLSMKARLKKLKHRRLPLVHLATGIFHLPLSRVRHRAL
ncbi:hypothetical protein BV898_06494 [Hypsibius exemplaris]|uniref:Receptor ligand binding region domain-containing protein n=1 Tax=Hypsibius exemplaris TaxID=2072580 RepID=A0A1W0WWD6_HYPEX|nr:hypothetical protein BV898_06494 [Hypsibius exemplaris]